MKLLKKIVWFTGLSGSGKTTIAQHLKERLEAEGEKVDLLDGDEIRNTLHKQLGFSREDIRENNHKIAELACERAKNFDVVLIPIISPYRADRAHAREIVGRGFIEVFVNTPLKICIERDVKGLYAKARRGEITDLIGMSEVNPYEPPERSDIEIPTDHLSVEESVARLYAFLKT